MKKRKIELESLRGIMCFIIAFFYHYKWLMTADCPIKHLSLLYEKGYYVVETFFVLSGFGMALGYSEKLRLEENINIISFLWRKMKKIWPIMTLALIFTTSLQVVHILVFGELYYVSELTVYSFLMSLLNISSGWFVLDINLNMPLWYLSALMLDYVIYYIVCRLSKKNKNLYIFLIFAIAFYGLAIVITGYNSDQAFTYYNVARGHACFFVGTILKEIYEYINVEKTREGIAYVLLICFIGISVLIFITHDETKVLAGSQWLSQMIWGNVLSPMLIWICIFCKPIKRIMKWKLLQKLGGVSTSIYIWHFPCYQLIRIISRYVSIKQFYNQVWFYGLVIIYITVVSVISNKIIEPWINNKINIIIHKIHQ